MNSALRVESMNEWSVLELHGDLKRAIEDSKECCVGDLHYTTKDVPILIIGCYKLEGKDEKMDKPMVVLEKTRIENNGGPNEFQYVVKAVIKRKVIFKGRPKPIVCNVPKVI